MKNKKLIYILIPAVVLIWGIIIYKIFMGANNPDELEIDNPMLTSAQELKAKTDTFSLVADYRDPFLGKTRRKFVPKPSPSRHKKKTVKKPVKKEKTIRWPLISYGGMIKNKSQEKALALVKLNNREKLMSAGDSATGIELLTIYKDSIEVKYKSEKKMVKKSGGEQ